MCVRGIEQQQQLARLRARGQLREPVGRDQHRIEIVSQSLTRGEAARGELLDPGSLAAIAGEVAGRQAARLSRDAYAGVYRAFCQFVGADAGPDALTPETVRAYRDLLEDQPVSSDDPRDVQAGPPRSA